MADFWSILYDRTGTAPGWYVRCVRNGVGVRWGPFPTEPEALQVQTRPIRQFPPPVYNPPEEPPPYEHKRPQQRSWRPDRPDPPP
jgi:hypothetical protein